MRLPKCHDVTFLQHSSVFLQNCSLTSRPWNTVLSHMQGKLSVQGFVCFCSSLLEAEGGKWDYGIILFIIRQIHMEGQFRAISPKKWNFKSMLWIEARREHKYGPQFIAISNVLKFHLNGRSNHYLRGKVIGTLTELFVASLRDILRPGTVYQQSGLGLYI